MNIFHTFSLLIFCFALSECYELLTDEDILRMRPDSEIIRESKRNSVLVGDMRFPKSHSRSAHPSSGIWPQNTIPYIISSNVTDLKDVVLKAIDHFHNYTCIKFRRREQFDNYWIRFLMADTSDGTLCSSYVGYRNERDQGIFLGPRCFFGSMVHELLHAVGFEHEQIRSDRGKFIEIIDDNIDESSTAQYEIECNGGTSRCTSNTYGVPYNYASIMHYCPYCGAKSSGGGPCFKVLNNKEALGREEDVGQRKWFSRGDWLMANRRYNCTIDESNAPPPLPANDEDKQRPDHFESKPTERPTTKKPTKKPKPS